MLDIYAISGKKGHGKDTFAKMVQEINNHFTIVHFADSLKKMACSAFGISKEQTLDPALKEIPFEIPITMDLYLDAMRSVTKLDNIKPAGMVARSPREVMQFFGTDYVRKAQDDFWIRSTLDRITDSQRVLIPDTRFVNELLAVQKINGYDIRIVRIDVPPSNDTHASEVEFEKIAPDLLVGVRTGDLSLPKWVASLVAIGDFELAKRFDYRGVLAAIKLYQNGTSEIECSDTIWGTGPKIRAFSNILDYYSRGRPDVLTGHFA